MRYCLSDIYFTIFDINYFVKNRNPSTYNRMQGELYKTGLNLAGLGANNPGFYEYVLLPNDPLFQSMF